MYSGPRLFYDLLTISRILKSAWFQNQGFQTGVMCSHLSAPVQTPAAVVFWMSSRCLMYQCSSLCVHVTGDISSEEVNTCCGARKSSVFFHPNFLFSAHTHSVLGSLHLILFLMCGLSGAALTCRLLFQNLKSSVYSWNPWKVKTPSKRCCSDGWARL